MMEIISYGILFVLCALIIFFLIMTVHARHLIIKKYIFVNQKVKTDCKICFISDFHYKHFLSKKHYEKMIQRVNDCQPDIVIFGGDYLHRNISASVEDAEYFIQLLSRVKARHHIAILGNHDKDNFNDTFWLKLFSKYNITLLVNECMNFDDFGVDVTGVDDFKKGKCEIGVIDVQGNFQLLVTHNPDFMEQLDKKLFDLVLSGHLHGGQGTIGFNLYPALRIFKLSAYGTKYRYGNVGLEGTNHISTSGVGAHFGLRFRVYPEVAFIHIKKKK